MMSNPGSSDMEPRSESDVEHLEAEAELLSDCCWCWSAAVAAEIG